MTVQSPEQPLPSRPAWEDDEIDLRAYILVLMQWWREIVLITLLAAAATIGGTLLLRQQQTARYKATANVVLARIVSQVQIDSRVSTVMETGGSDNVWRSSLVHLVRNGTTAAAVYEELADRLPEDVRSPAWLTAIIEAEIAAGADNRTLSDILLISATTEDPNLSAAIADAWARHFVRYINTLYGEIPEDTIETVRTELEAARQEWETAQTAYEQFIISNRLDEYQNELATKVEVRDSLLARQRQSMATLLNTDQANRTEVYSAIARAQTSNIVAGIQANNDSALQTLTYLQHLQNAIDLQLTQATGLVALLEAGGDPATTGDALRLLKLQIFAATPPGINVPGGFNTITTAPPAAPSDPQSLLNDARTLIAILEENRGVVDAAIAAQTEALIERPAAVTLDVLTTQPTGDTSAPDAETSSLATILTESHAALFTPSDSILAILTADQESAGAQTLITQLDTDIRELRSVISAENARERQITQRRDLAWTAYEALSNKLQELNLMRTAANSQVRLASQAVPPLRPVPAGSLLIPIVGGTGVAFLFAIFLALFVNMMGGKPFLTRREAQA